MEKRNRKKTYPNQVTFFCSDEQLSKIQSWAEKEGQTFFTRKGNNPDGELIKKYKLSPILRHRLFKRKPATKKDNILLALSALIDHYENLKAKNYNQILTDELLQDLYNFRSVVAK